MTEDEAKTKICPVGKMRTTFDDNWDKGACAASKCMAWRWRYEQTNKTLYGQTQWPTVEPIYRQTEDGYCGLAGRPG